MTQPRMTVRFAAVTHPGLVRPDNEDACLAVPPVFLVADGMEAMRGVSALLARCGAGSRNPVPENGSAALRSPESCGGRPTTSRA